MKSFTFFRVYFTLLLVCFFFCSCYNYSPVQQLIASFFIFLRYYIEALVQFICIGFSGLRSHFFYFNSDRLLLKSSDINWVRRTSPVSAVFFLSFWICLTSTYCCRNSLMLRAFSLMFLGFISFYGSCKFTFSVFLTWTLFIKLNWNSSTLSKRVMLYPACIRTLRFVLWVWCGICMRWICYVVLYWAKLSWVVLRCVAICYVVLRCDAVRALS